MAVPDYAGHRNRLRERFDRTGLEGLHDYEVLELLLAHTLPRQDTKPLAKRLKERFGSVAAVLNATREELQQVDGMGPRSATLLRLVHEVGSYCMREKIAGRSAINHSRDVQQYLRLAFGSRSDEFIAALYLDSQNGIISAEIVAEGTVNQCSLYPRELFAQAFRYGAAALILAHNHPGGSLEPSDADWQITKRLLETGRLLDIKLLDHLIVSRSDVCSLREKPRWNA